LQLKIASKNCGIEFIVNDFSEASLSSGSNSAYAAKRRQVSIVEHILQDNGFDATICTAVTYEAIDKSHCIYAGNLNGSSLVNGINLTRSLLRMK